MPLVRVSGRPSDALVDHADGRWGRSCLEAHAFRLPGRGRLQRQASRHRGARATRGEPLAVPWLVTGTPGAAACLDGARPSRCWGRP